MKEERKNIRYPTAAQARLLQDDGYEMAVKDISIDGCRLMHPLAIDLALNREYTLEILPEPEVQAAPFIIKVEPYWSKRLYGAEPRRSRETGCLISAYPEGKGYQQFANYLAWQAVRP
jgi:hypothetical protein